MSITSKIKALQILNLLCFITGVGILFYGVYIMLWGTIEQLVGSTMLLFVNFFIYFLALAINKTKHELQIQLEKQL